MRSIRAFVFASDMEQGNEARVVLHGPGALSTDEMQRWAAEQGAPVAAFVEAGDTDERRVRFFTARTELPYCGHGALAAGRVLLDQIRADHGALLVGEQRIEIQRTGSRVTALITRPVELELEAEPGAVLACLGLTEAVSPVWRASIGSPKWLVEVANLAALYAVRVDAPALSALSRERAVNGVYLYTRSGTLPGVDAEARGFNPRSGALEDSATGVGAGALAWALLRDAPEQTHYVIRQGKALGQDNRIVVELDSAPGKGASTRVGGNVTVEER
jgi:PhzF family phenazine biosynthesis protein